MHIPFSLIILKIKYSNVVQNPQVILDLSGSFVDSVLFFFFLLSFPVASVPVSSTTFAMFLFLYRAGEVRRETDVSSSTVGEGELFDASRSPTRADVTRPKRQMTDSLRISISSVGRHFFPRPICAVSTRLNCIASGTSHGTIRYCF